MFNTYSRQQRGEPLTVFPGMEITSREEVHILGLFESMESLLQLQDIVYQALPGLNNEELFGCQAIVNEKDEVEGFNERLLIGSTTLDLRRVTEIIRDLGGIVVAAHIDRESFGILGQLGFFPDDVHFDALEISSEPILSGQERHIPFPILRQLFNPPTRIE